MMASLSKIPKQRPLSHQLFDWWAVDTPLPPCPSVLHSGYHGRDRIRPPVELSQVRTDQPHGEGQVQSVRSAQEGPRRAKKGRRSLLRGHGGALHRREEAEVEGSLAETGWEVNSWGRGLLIVGSINQPRCVALRDFAQVDVALCLCCVIVFFYIQRRLCLTVDGIETIWWDFV